MIYDQEIRVLSTPPSSQAAASSVEEGRTDQTLMVALVELALVADHPNVKGVGNDVGQSRDT